MNRVRFVALALCLLASCPTTRAQPPSEQLLAGEFDAWFQQQVLAENILGAAFAVVSREGVIRIGTAGFTETRRKQAINADTAFRIASVSKTFAAELTAVMVQEGRLGWDDPITMHLPGFQIKGDASRIQIRDLLGQSTGLVPHAYDNLIEAGLSAAEIQSKLANLSIICTPGRCFSYQNSVFSLIEPVVEKVAADSYARLIDQRIFKPLDMRTASVGYEAFMATGNRAEPHVLSRGQWKTIPVLPHYYRVAPAAGVNASVRDMAKWLMAQLGADPAVIAPEMVSTVITPRVRTRRELYRREWRHILTDAHYGLGWRVYQIGDEQIGYHSGWVSGYRADVAFSTSYNIGIAVLMNVESTSINTLTTRFWELAFARLKPAGPTLSP